MDNKNNSAIQNPPYFIQKKSIPIWVSTITAALILIFFYGPSYAIEDQKQAISFLNTNAEILVTILAVTMSFTVLGIEFLVESYTPRALTGYLMDKVIYGFPILYISLISLSLISSNIPSVLPPLSYLQFSVIGTIISLVYLVAFVYYIINKIQPESLIMETSKNIRINDWKYIVETGGRLDTSLKAHRPFIILQQMMVKSVTNNDIFSFAAGLGLLFDRLNYYLNVTLLEATKNRHDFRREPSYVYRFFFALFSPLVTESLLRGREQFIIQYQWHMFNQMRTIYSFRDHKTINDFWKLLDYLGHKIFNLEMLSAADSYLKMLDGLVMFEIQELTKTKSGIQKYPLAYLNYITDGVYDEFLANDFQFHRIKCLAELGAIAANKGMKDLVNSILYIIYKILQVVYKIDDRITRRRFLFSTIQCLKRVYEASADNGIHDLTWSTDMLSVYIQKISNLDEARSLTESFCNLSFYSVKKGNYSEVTQLGITGSELVDEYPELTIIILETLRKSAEFMRKEEDLEIRRNVVQDIVKALNNIKRSNERNHPKINSIIKGALTWIDRTL